MDDGRFNAFCWDQFHGKTGSGIDRFTGNFRKMKYGFDRMFQPANG